MDDKYKGMRFYSDAAGRVEPLFDALGCMEKIEYMFLKDSAISLFEIFCDDIMPVFGWSSEGGSIYYSVLQDKEKYVYYTEHTFGKTDIVAGVNNLLVYTPIIVATSFDLLKCYQWHYETWGRSYAVNHAVMVIGVDEDYYYLVEDPDTLVESVAHRWDGNREICMIERAEFEIALRDRARIKTIEINQNWAYQKLDIAKRIKQMIDEYNCIDPITEEEMTCYKGRRALEELKQYLEMGRDFSEILQSVKWQLHIIKSRHYILKNCFVNRDETIYEVCEECECLWEKMKNIIIKTYLTNSYIHHKSLAMLVKDIIDGEDRLILALKKYYNINCAM